MSTKAPQTRDAVTAIIVAHDGARSLPALIRAVKAQTHPIERALGVDTASRDDSRAVLADYTGQDAVFGMDRSTGFGEAVATALRHSPRRRPGEWIWLLHDDCEPAPDTLERLLRAAGRDRAAVVVGPKVLDGQDRRTLREVGISIDRAGRRVTGIDAGEIDQGQHDHKRAVLAVSSAGMLVRRDVWDRLGGFDPNLKFFRDDVDFCWRVQAAGWRVHVATDAVLYHWALAGRGRRQVQGGSVPAVDRRNALFVLAVNLPLIPMLWIVGGCVLGSLARALYFLLTKQLDQSAAYALSVLGLFAHPIRLLKGRRRRAKGIAEGYYAVRVFIPPARTLAKLAERIAWRISNGRPGGRHQATTEESEEDAQFVDQPSVVRRIIANPGVQLFLVLLLITLIATRRLLGASPLGGGALVPAWGGALALWQEYLAGFHAVSVGSAAAAPSYLAVVAGIATLLGGQARFAVDVLLLGCVPLAGTSAYVATRWIVTATPARVLLAASYALLPVATGAVAAGRLGTATAFILLPLIAVGAGRMLTAAPRQARRAAWATGLLIGIAAAFAPLTWVLGVVFAAAAVGVRRWLVAVTPVNAAIVVVTPFFVLFPWSLHLLASPSAFLFEAGLATPNLTTHGLSATALLALSLGGPGMPPVWVTAGFAFALVALVLPSRRLAVVIGGWAAAVVGLLAAVLVSRVSVTPPGGGQPADSWPGVATALAALGLLLASAPAAEWLASIIRGGSGILPSDPSASGRGRWSRRLLAAAALIGAATAPLFVAGYWVTDGVRGPVGSLSAQLLPTFISASSTSNAQYRTLILRHVGAALDYQVVRQGDPSLGEPELGIPAAAEAVLSRQVASFGSRDGADAGDPGLVLGSFGIKWVMLPAPVDLVLASRLDASLGLVALNKGPSYDLWQVTGPVGQVRLVAPSGATTVLSPATGGMSGLTVPASGGTLVLAEPYGGWTARLNGRALKPVATPVGGWAQGFVLPPGGGHLSITHNGLSRLLSLILELVATLAVIVLALPGKRVDPTEEAEALAALREAKASTSGRRAARRRAGAGGRLRAGAGHWPVNRAISAVDRFGFGRRLRGDRTPADEGPPESPALGSQLPAEPDAEPAEPARAGAAATAVRAGQGHARHRGAVGDTALGSAFDAAGTGGMPAAPWEMSDDWDRPAPAPARQTGQQPAASGFPAPGDFTPGSSRWDTGPLNLPGETAADAGQGDDSDRQESSRWAADSLDTSRPVPDTERSDDSARPNRKGDQVRRSGRHAAAPGASSEPSASVFSPRESSRQESPAPGSPVQEAPVPESRPPWEAGPRRPPRASGPQAPAPAGGAQPRKPRGSGPQAPAPSAGAGAREPWESGPREPVTSAGAQSASPAGTQSAWRTDAKSAWGTGPLPAARTGRQPAFRTGPRPTFTPTGPQPTFTPTGGQPTFTPAGTAPVSASGTPPVEPGTPPVEKAPWGSDDRGEAAAWDTIAGNPDAVPAARNPGDGSQGSDGNQPAGAPMAEQGPAPGNRAAASPSAKPERHSHRAGKHGKPSRWRGSGNRPGGDRES